MQLDHVLIALPILHGISLCIFYLCVVPSPPPHLLNHTLTTIPELLSPPQQESLQALLQTLGKTGLQSNLADTKATHPLHEHIGESVPSVDGTCDHKYLIPSLDKTECILAQRIDIGKSYLTTGGVLGMKDSYDVAISRLQSFGEYIFDPSAYPVIEELFESPAFLDAAKATCPPNKQHLDPFQFNIIVQVPGQTVATHIDAVYFLGADRFTLPQWLLAAMKFSGLFEDRFVDQVQIVTYFHDWDPSSPSYHDRRGEFVYYEHSNKPAFVPPTPRSATAVDGSKVIHAASGYFPDRLPPALDKSKENKLVLTGNKWSVLASGIPVATYAPDELRSTLVFRARCFENEGTLRRFKEKRPEDALLLEDVLATLSDNIPSSKKSNRLDLALAILDKYVHYPPPTVQETLLPFNYCMLGKLMPALSSVLSAVCTTFD